jgi:hypothetical protein
LNLAKIGKENTHEHWAKISLLRKGTFTEERKILESLSAPLRDLITQGINFVGK